jgi:hypothetical protein
MKSLWWRSVLFPPLLLAFACATSTEISSRDAAVALGGTSWQLVNFQGSDGKTLTPDDGENTPSRSATMAA